MLYSGKYRIKSSSALFRRADISGFATEESARGALTRALTSVSLLSPLPPHRPGRRAGMEKMKRIKKRLSLTLRPSQTVDESLSELAEQMTVEDGGTKDSGNRSDSSFQELRRTGRTQTTLPPILKAGFKGQNEDGTGGGRNKRFQPTSLKPQMHPDDIMVGLHPSLLAPVTSW